MTKKTIAKKSLSGIELEFLLINSNGKVVEDTDPIRKKLRKENKIRLIEEGGKPQLETSSLPKVNVANTTQHLLNTLRETAEKIEKESLFLFPFGTYLGKYNWTIRDKQYYHDSSRVFGDENYRFGNRCQGLHYHYSLPRGTYDRKTKSLKLIGGSKYKDSLVHHFNFSIAMDPAITCLMQSSPFLMGVHTAKDMRLIANRQGIPFGATRALCIDLPENGSLPGYEHTVSDIMHKAEQRKELFLQKMQEKKMSLDLGLAKMPALKYSWNPVRINQIGTLEIRSIDANSPEYVIAAAAVLKFISRKIHQDFLKVCIDEVGINEPFKLEDNLVHVPPFSYVEGELQKNSCIKGMSDKTVRRYVRGFMNFAKKCIYEEYEKVIEPFKKVVKKKRTVSDLILNAAKRRGANISGGLDESIAREISLSLGEKIPKKLDLTVKLIENLED